MLCCIILPCDFVGHVARRGEGTERRAPRRAAEASEDRNAAAKIVKQSGARGRSVERYYIIIILLYYYYIVLSLYYHIIIICSTRP